MDNLTKVLMEAMLAGIDIHFAKYGQDMRVTGYKVGEGIKMDMAIHFRELTDEYLIYAIRKIIKEL